MIRTVLTIGFQRLIHNRVELMLTFVVPVCFFSIFAIIFGRGMGTTPRVKTLVVDMADTVATKAVLADIEEHPGVRLMATEESISADQARDRVRRGHVTIAILLREDRGRVQAELLADRSDQVAPQVVSAFLTESILSNQVAATAANAAQGSGRRSATTATVDRIHAKSNGSAGEPLVEGPKAPIVVTDVMQAGKSNPVVSMYAAGIAVMFLLFGATNGGGALLEERENQTLERLLSTRLTMNHLLLGKWVYQSIIGVVQVTVMFLWAQIVFGVDLIGHLDGFAIMTFVTSMAAAAFGLFLATLCKSRGQLNGLSVIVILTMSALGGSMVPRYVMSESLRDAGLWTFNAWALDGYDKVFWRDLPVATLTPQITVLAASTILFWMLARALALRWERG